MGYPYEWNEREQKNIDDNAKMLSEIESKFGEDVMSDIKEEFKECENPSDWLPFEIVKEAEGEKQYYDYKTTDHIYVDQTENGGYSGDSYSGYVYFPLPDKTYFKFHYSM